MNTIALDLFLIFNWEGDLTKLYEKSAIKAVRREIPLCKTDPALFIFHDGSCLSFSKKDDKVIVGNIHQVKGDVEL